MAKAEVQGPVFPVELTFVASEGQEQDVVITDWRSVACVATSSQHGGHRESHLSPLPT